MAPQTAAHRNIIIFFWKVRSWYKDKYFVKNRLSLSQETRNSFSSFGLLVVINWQWQFSLSTKTRKCFLTPLSPFRFFFFLYPVVWLSSINALRPLRSSLRGWSFWDCIVSLCVRLQSSFMEQYTTLGQESIYVNKIQFFMDFAFLNFVFLEQNSILS